MANGERQISYGEYKHFKPEEKDLFQFTAFRTMHEIPKRYAKKWVEKVVITVITVTGIAVLSAVIGTVVVAGR